MRPLPQPSADPADQPLGGIGRLLLCRLAHAQAQGRVPSVAGCALIDGRTAWTGVRGHARGVPPTLDTQYRIGSLTKSFTAVLVMRLRDRGELRTDEPLETYLPGTVAGDRTVRQLLAHTAGLAAMTPGCDWPYSGPGPAHPLPSAAGVLCRAGERFQYSNIGYALLGAVVERVRQEPWEDVLAREVLAPLGLRGTGTVPGPGAVQGWSVHPWAPVLVAEEVGDARAMAAAGALWSTPADLARWAEFLLGDGAGVLHADTLAEMAEPTRLSGRDDEPGAGFGLGLQVVRHQGRTLVGHPGGIPGHLATVWVDRGRGTGAVVVGNASTGLSPSRALELLDIVGEQTQPLPREWVPQDLPRELLELTGYWYQGPRPHSVQLEPDGGLLLRPVSTRTKPSRFRAPASRFGRTPRGGLAGVDGAYAGEELRVCRGPDGRPVALELAGARFTRDPGPAPAEVPPPSGTAAG
ncbi:serine hydrolase domain-containing protein [Streptomyces hygroscopicus]|uniref:CubicO group peptidase (Beta-lactamase class C family) n=1 Tax=Streptomyces demainii TaxID=588122 RepID=A0ABT9KW51_9ACTN|nr:serine hydrolase domain-containing protein [Streptomyces demainii]MDP9612589.1 CubicO group peptidase (beta-lactamase class C family) [Streptomyces demainii]